jgi:hypothetical protein
METLLAFLLKRELLRRVRKIDEALLMSKKPIDPFAQFDSCPACAFRLQKGTAKRLRHC